MIVALLGGSYWRHSVALEQDSTTLCPVTGPSAVNAILIDQSDPISPLQLQRLSQILDQTINDASVGERIDLYVLAHDSMQSLAPVISLCRPKSEGNMFYENPSKVRERYIERFRRPLDQTLKALTTATNSDISPIMESIKAACVAAFGAMPKETPARLLIVSDMIQNSKVLNQYKQRDFDTFAHSTGYAEVLADCHRASVSVVYLLRPRDQRVQDRMHQLFWEKFFDRENAFLKQMEAI